MLYPIELWVQPKGTGNYWAMEQPASQKCAIKNKKVRATDFFC
jgi:hypothetical protein